MTTAKSDKGGEPPAGRPGAGTVIEVFAQALRLGLTSFGGPVAHIGYFERAYVQKLRWLGAEQFAAVVALCQLLPGPASSQTGFLIGLHRAGWAGALAAWLGFTLPSACIMYAAARLAGQLSGATAAAALHGLHLVAVAVVAQAVWAMWRRLCPDRPRSAIALIAAVPLLLVGAAGLQLAVLGGGAVAGLLLCRNLPHAATSFSGGTVSPRAGWFALAVFAALFVCASIAGTATDHGLGQLAGIVYRSGSLVFGGGHVVLPLLRGALVPQGWLSDSRFLAGYGLAQAVPGPLFSFSAYIGAAVAPPGQSLLWSSVALTGIFLPGLLLALAGAAMWGRLTRSPGAGAALAGINAAVVGILAAALYDPLWKSAVHSGADVAVAAAALWMLERAKLPPVVVVLLGVAICIATGIGT